MNTKITKHWQWPGLAFQVSGHRVTFIYRGTPRSAWCSVDCTRKDAANAIRQIRAKRGQIASMAQS